jgi:hypothetical protein
MPLSAECVWQNHVQQNHGKNPNGTGNDMVRDKVRDNVGHVPWSPPLARLSRTTTSRGDGGSPAATSALKARNIPARGEAPGRLSTHPIQP